MMKYSKSGYSNSPGGLEVEAAGDAIKVEALARGIETGRNAAFHAAEIGDLALPQPTQDRLGRDRSMNPRPDSLKKADSNWIDD